MRTVTPLAISVSPSACTYCTVPIAGAFKSHFSQGPTRTQRFVTRGRQMNNDPLLAAPPEENVPVANQQSIEEPEPQPKPETQLHPILEPSTPDVTALCYNHSSYPPPSYAQSHDSTALSFPDTPKTELPPIQSHNETVTGANNSLPSLSTITGPQPQLYGHSRQQSRQSESSYSPPPPKPNQWPSMNPLTTFYTPSHAADSPQRMDVDRSSSVSLDDPDVRMAAEALGDLRAGMYKHS